MESVYKLCFYGGLALCILLLVLAVVLFFVLKIPKAIGDLTGHNAKKSIKDMKDGAVTESKASRKEKSKYYNQNTGEIKVRDTVSPEMRKSNRDNTTDLLDSKKVQKMTETTVLNEKVKAEVAATTKKYADVPPEPETGVLTNLTPEELELAVSQISDTAEIDDEATNVLASDADDEATDVLVSDADDEATDVLTSDTDDEATDLLTSDTDDEATDVLTSDTDDEATDILTGDMDDEPATDVLRSYDDEAGTSVLTTNTSMDLARRVRVSYNYVVVHTDESL